MVLSFFGWLAVLITIPALTIWAMWIYQAQQGKYIWENEVVNKFFLFFSWIGNWTLNLFDANHYQIIDEERYRTEDQFYPKPSKEEKDEKSESTQTNNTTENSQSTQGETWNSAVDTLDIQNHEINNETVETKNLDNDQQISINNQDIWIDLSGHEINESWDFKLDL
jgi:4-amino-4-deoxy-L-arabinose transferase-like glycosyltransferase